MSRWPVPLSMLRFYPKRPASLLAGRIAGIKLPRRLRCLLLGSFARAYGVDIGEAEKPLVEYPSLQAFFTRRLRPGLRPQDEMVLGALNSPVDARIIAYGRVDSGTMIQAKGLPYRISELLKYDPDPQRFEGGHYLTLYLSPRDYHRIHVPCEGCLQAVGFVEGELWPVNNLSTAIVPRLYERNRRAMWVAIGAGPDSGLEVACILVGALHVGGVLIDARWRQERDLPRNGMLEVPDLPCTPGEDLGTFVFGSTVILIIGGSRAAEWKPCNYEGFVKVGQRLGAF